MSTLEQAFKAVLGKYDADGPALDRLWSEVVREHSLKGRHYHTLRHLEDLHTILGEVKDQGQEPDALVLATAYHDIVYSVTRQDNEEHSAQRMRDRLAPVGLPEALMRRVEGHILATKSHHASLDPDTDLFTDADLSILGSTPQRYKAYAEEVRKEYRRYPDLIYKPGRRKVLQHFLAMERIYKTTVFHERFGTQAVLNMREEQRSLGGDRRGGGSVAHLLASLYLARRMMTSAQIDLVRNSWTALLPRAVRFADVLYEELFGAEPHLRILFEGTMDEQHKKLAAIVTQAVDQLDDQAGLKRSLHTLGVRHKSYGVKPYHFDALGQAWIAALVRMLGADFTPEVRAAWEAFYALLKEGMQEGLQPVPASQH